MTNEELIAENEHLRGLLSSTTAKYGRLVGQLQEKEENLRDAYARLDNLAKALKYAEDFVCDFMNHGTEEDILTLGPCVANMHNIAKGLSSVTPEAQAYFDTGSNGEEVGHEE